MFEYEDPRGHGDWGSGGYPSETSMSKRYAEPIEIEALSGSIRAFWWRGRRYTVRRTIARWREAGGWWRSPEEAPWTASDAREIVRIETGGGGTYEIAHDQRTGRWLLHRILD